MGELAALKEHVDRFYPRDRTTVVFDFDLRCLKGNPHKVETPFGTPITVSIGNACERADMLEEICHAFAEAVESGALEHRFADAMKLYSEVFDTPATPDTD